MTQELLEQRENEAHLRAEGCEWPREGGTRSTSAGTLLPKDAEGETGASRGDLQPHRLGLQRDATRPRLLEGLSPPRLLGMWRKRQSEQRLGQESQQCWV